MSKDEYDQFFSTRQSWVQHMNQVFAKFEEQFYNEDDNGDCFISQQEFYKYNTNATARRKFPALDANGDLKINLKERVNPFYHTTNMFSSGWPFWAKSIP